MQRQIMREIPQNLERDAKSWEFASSLAKELMGNWHICRIITMQFLVKLLATKLSSEIYELKMWKEQ
jgi:hypothetical protein